MLFLIYNTTLNSAGNVCKLFLNLRVHSQRERTVYVYSEKYLLN